MTRTWMNMAALAWEAQQVIALRLARLAGGGAESRKEAERMIAEKVSAGLEASGRLMTGASVNSVVSDYRRKVRANARRLRRG